MLPMIAGFGWGAVARIALVAGVALAVWLAFSWFTGVLDENAALKLENTSLQTSLLVERQARERANKAAADLLRRNTAIRSTFDSYREADRSDEYDTWADNALPAGLSERLRSLAGGGNGNSGSAAEPDRQ